MPLGVVYAVRHPRLPRLEAFKICGVVHGSRNTEVAQQDSRAPPSSGRLITMPPGLTSRCSSPR